MDHHCNYTTTINVASTGMENECESVAPEIHRAVFLNNRGAKLVRHCEYGAAVRAFTSVLNILKPLASTVEMTNSSEKNTNDVCDYTHQSVRDSGAIHFSAPNNTEEYMDVDSAPRRPQVSTSQSYWNGGLSPRPYPSSVSSSPITTKRKLSAKVTSKLLSTAMTPFERQNVSHFVFRDPVEIPTESLASGAMAKPSCDLFSKFLMIVMYNLALTLHLHALSIGSGCEDKKSTNSSDSDTNLRKAKKLFLRSRKLYELAFEMHLDEACDVHLLFTLALINNLGLVYGILGEKQRSRTCFKNMFSTMMYLLDTNESHEIEEWDGLLSNVMDILFKHHREIAAPAA